MKKKVLFIVSCLFLIGHLAVCQSVEKVKIKGDNNFYSRKYAESLKWYKQVIDDHHQGSERLLLKTAYLSEEVQDYPRSLYSLYLFLEQNPSIEALQYIQQMAATYMLKGHDLTDWKYVSMLYYKYYNLLAVLAVICVLAMFYYNFIKKKSAAGGRLVFMLALLLTFALFFNVLNKEPRLIIKYDNTLLMKGPSSASNVVQVLNKGNLFEVTGKEDVWIQISWDAQKAYVKESQVYYID